MPETTNLPEVLNGDDAITADDPPTNRRPSEVPIPGCTDHKELPGYSSEPRFLRIPDGLPVQRPAMVPDPMVAWKPPAIPKLTTAEIEVAIRAGGFIGVRRAMAAKLPGQVADLDLTTDNASRILDQYVSGIAETMADYLSRLDAQIISASIHTEAIKVVAAWIGRNPGQIQPGSQRGQHRVFD